jgi:hypothetical protein
MIESNAIISHNRYRKPLEKSWIFRIVWIACMIFGFIAWCRGKYLPTPMENNIAPMKVDTTPGETSKEFDDMMFRLRDYLIKQKGKNQRHW